MVKRSRPKISSVNGHSRRGVVRRQSKSRPPASTPVATPQPAPRPGPAAEAVARFDEAMRALQQHSYAEAARRFQEVLDEFPGERGLRDRSQVYLDLCERELHRRPAALTSIEERLTAATAALNDDDDERAEELAKGVLAEQPRQDLALYIIAAVAARRGNRDAAIEWLSRAIAVSPELSAQVRHDADFAELRKMDAFHRVLEMPHPPGREARRARVGS